MSKKLNQSKIAKENFKSEMLDYLTTNPETHTKLELASHFHISEREVRRKIEEVANYYPVIATSNQKGYRVAIWSKDMSSKELKDTLEDIMHEVREINSRIRRLKARLKPLIANKVVLEKIITEKEVFESEEHEN